MAASAKLYDVIRIDHFIGIVKYYTIPADMPDARQGEYRQGRDRSCLMLLMNLSVIRRLLLRT